MDAGSGQNNTKTNGNGNGNNKNGNNRNNKVHEVDYDSNSDVTIEEDADVEAVGGAKKKQNGAQGQTKPRGDKNMAAPGTKWCYFCRTTGHVNRECEKKKKHMASKKTGTSAISASDDHQQPAYYGAEANCIASPVSIAGRPTVMAATTSEDRPALPERATTTVHIGNGLYMEKSAVSQIQNFVPSGNGQREW
jgi:hypothetical protein